LCINHNQHFIATQNTHPISCSTYSHIDILLAEILYIIIISLNDIPLIIWFFCHPISRSKTITTYDILDLFYILYASHKSNPSSLPQDNMELRTLCFVEDCKCCGKYTLQRIS
jgi:hypothetical protein